MATKQQGNEFFKKGDYDEAIRCYEEGMRVCPKEEKEEIAKFHQNIAASYDKMVHKLLVVSQASLAIYPPIVSFCRLQLQQIKLSRSDKMASACRETTEKPFSK